MSSATRITPPDLSWEAAPLAGLLRLAWPIVVSMLSVSTMTLVDTLFVSRLGPAAVAGVGLAGILTFNLWCFPMGTVRVVKILVSQAVGAGRGRECRPYLTVALALACVLGLAAMGIGLLLAPRLQGFTATVESGRLAGHYLSVRVLGTVTFLVLISIEDTRQGLGDSRSVMCTTLLGNSINVALDYWFVFGLGWGVAGAAWASNCALLCELLALGAWHARRDGFDLRSARRRHLRELLRLGIPSGIQFGLEVGSFAVMVMILSSFSEVHTAAHQIGIQVLHFSFLPAVALGEAACVLVGQAVGAQRPGLVSVVAWRTLGVALAYAALCGSVLFLAADPIVGAFTREPALFGLATNLFMLLAAFQFFDAANIVVRGILRGTGDVRFVAVVGIVAAWISTPPLTYLLGCRLGWGVYGAWAGISGEVAIATTVLCRRLITHAWQSLGTQSSSGATGWEASPASTP